MAPQSILIVGCSVAGPTLATFLLLSPLPAAQKPRITLVERAPALRTQGQNVDIRGPGLTILRKLGLETLVRAATTGEAGTRHEDARGRVWAAFPADRSGATQTPTADIEILRGHLAALCHRRSQLVSDDVQRAGGAGIEYLLGEHPASIDQDGDAVEVMFAASGARRRFDLVVGADGLQSRTRAMAFGAAGEGERLRPLGMYLGFFSMPRTASDVPWQRWFHAPGRRGITLRPDERNGRTTACLHVVSELDRRLDDAARRTAPGKGGAEAQKALLAEYYADVGWEAPRVLREMWATDDFYFDMVAQVKMDRWSRGRVVLVGDAGYCASPISGMGTTLALAGAYHLAGALARHPADLEAALADYETEMRPLVQSAQKLPPGVFTLLNPDTEWGIWLSLAFMAFLVRSGLFGLLLRLLGRPPNAVPVKDYGFPDLQELSEESEPRPKD